MRVSRRLKSTKGPAPRDAGSLLADSKALLVLGLGPLEANILGDHLIRHIAAGRYEVATRPQVPAPERLAQLSPIHEQVVGGLPLNRLHHAARGELRRYFELQVHMVRPDVTLENLDVVRAADLADQIPHLDRDVASKDRLAILRAEDEMVVQLINGMGGATVRVHADNVSQAS